MKTLEEISDRIELEELMVSYSHAIDFKNFDELDDVFTPDAFIDYSEMADIKGSLPEIKAFLATAMKQVTACQHGISTSQIKIEGDRAFGRTICTNPNAPRIVRSCCPFTLR